LVDRTEFVRPKGKFFARPTASFQKENAETKTNQSFKDGKLNIRVCNVTFYLFIRRAYGTKNPISRAHGELI